MQCISFLVKHGTAGQGAAGQGLVGQGAARLGEAGQGSGADRVRLGKR
jgi:hypothetical protein